MQATSLIAGVLGLTLLVSGCASERVLRVTSVPRGAVVYIDGEDVGTTPVRVPFDFYGTRRVTLHHDGYLTHSEPIELSPPWYARFPMDIVSEVLLPLGWRDKRRYHVELTPGEDLVGIPTLRSVIERAGVFRHAGAEGPRDLPTTEPIEVPPGGGPDEP